MLAKTDSDIKDIVDLLAAAYYNNEKEMKEGMKTGLVKSAAFTPIIHAYYNGILDGLHTSLIFILGGEETRLLREYLRSDSYATVWEALRSFWDANEDSF